MKKKKTERKTEKGWKEKYHDIITERNMSNLTLLEEMNEPNENDVSYMTTCNLTNFEIYSGTFFKPHHDITIPQYND